MGPWTLQVLGSDGPVKDISSFEMKNHKVAVYHPSKIHIAHFLAMTSSTSKRFLEIHIVADT